MQVDECARATSSRAANIWPRPPIAPPATPRPAARHLPAGWPWQSGFGTIYATNITPDPDDGIGRWTADDFWRALHDGVRRDGQQLYPAMPYTSYRGMTRADADAIYAYVMQLRPAKVPTARPSCAFPFNIRLGMLGWNLLFLTDSLPAVSTGSSPAWQRGRYLVDVLGHCGECHTPRGIFGQMELSRPMTGSRSAASPRPTSRRPGWRRAAGRPRHCATFSAAGSLGKARRSATCIRW